MHPGVAALSLEQQGFVLGTVLARRSAVDALRLAGGGNAPWRAALEALVAQPRPLRAATVAELIGLVQAALPAGLERIHPGWLRERLLPEPSLVVRAVTDGLPQEVRRVAAEVLSERGETVGPSIGCPPPAAAALRRAVFAGFIPLAGPSRKRSSCAAPPRWASRCAARRRR